MKLRLTTAAIRDLDHISTFIAESERSAATDVIRGIRASSDLLTAFPRIGHHGWTGGTREWLVRGLPYIVIYRIDAKADRLVVLAVLHGARHR